MPSTTVRDTDRYQKQCDHSSDLIATVHDIGGGVERKRYPPVRNSRDSRTPPTCDDDKNHDGKDDTGTELTARHETEQPYMFCHPGTDTPIRSFRAGEKQVADRRCDAQPTSVSDIECALRPTGHQVGHGVGLDMTTCSGSHRDPMGSINWDTGDEPAVLGDAAVRSLVREVMTVAGKHRLIPLVPAPVLPVRPAGSSSLRLDRPLRRVD